MSDVEINLLIGNLQGEMRGIHATNKAILHQLELISKNNVDLYTSTKSNGERIAQIERDLEDIDDVLDTLKASRNKALGFVAAITMLAAIIGAAFSKVIEVQ